VGERGRLFEKIDESDKDQKTKEVYEHIYTVSEKCLSHIQHVRRLHATESDPPIRPESSPSTSPTYISGTDLMANPPVPNAPTALSIDENAEHVKKSLFTCFNDYCLIYNGAKDPAWYLQRLSYATHYGRHAYRHFL
jgi:hypothetical protein